MFPIIGIMIPQHDLSYFSRCLEKLWTEYDTAAYTGVESHLKTKKRIF